MGKPNQQNKLAEKNIPSSEKNILADFINSDDTNKENTVHENASAASDNDGDSSESLDFKNEAEINDHIDEDFGESETVSEELKDIPRKYWKHQTV